MISTKGRYAVRIMIDLGQHHEMGVPVPLEDVARRQNISKKYLEAIVRELVRAKLVIGLRGKGGGYLLTRAPAEYPIGEILECTEGPLAPVACLAPGAELCDRAKTCKSLSLWQRYDALTHDFFYKVSLKEVIDEEPLAKE